MHRAKLRTLFSPVFPPRSAENGNKRMLVLLATLQSISTDKTHTALFFLYTHRARNTRTPATLIGTTWSALFSAIDVSPGCRLEERLFCCRAITSAERNSLSAQFRQRLYRSAISAIGYYLALIDRISGRITAIFPRHYALVGIPSPLSS